ERTLARADSVCRALDQSVKVRHALFGGEVVHFVVEQKSKSLSGNARAKVVIQRGSDGDSVTFGIDHGIVRGVFRLLNGFRLWMRTGVTVQLGEDCGTPQRATGRGAAKVDSVAPGVAVSFVDELRHRNLGEVGIAEELRAIEKCALVSFCRQMYCLRRIFAWFGQVVTFQNVKALDEGNTSGRRRRRAVDVESRLGAATGRRSFTS